MKNELLFVFPRNLFCTKALLWSVTSPKLPLKNESFHLFSIFQKMEPKTQILVFVSIEFRILNSNLIFKFLFPFGETTFFFLVKKVYTRYRMRIPSLNHFVHPKFSHKTSWPKCKIYGHQHSCQFPCCYPFPLEPFW